MWVKANLNFDRFKQGKVYEVEDAFGQALLGAAYFVAPCEEVADGKGESDPREEGAGGTTGGDPVGETDESSDPDGGEEAGTEG